MQESENPIVAVHLAATFLLSGASGMLGSALRRELSARCLPVRQLVRRPPVAKGEVRWNPGLEPALADTGALEGCDPVVHLSGASIAGRRWTAAYREVLCGSRIESTAALARVLAGLQHRPRTLIVASAIGFYGDKGGDLLDETSPPGNGFLANLCRQWEEAAQPARDAGIRVVQARFGVVLGREGGALRQMLPAFRLGLGGRLGDGHQWMSWVSLDDAVAAILFAVEKPSLSGPLNVTSPNPVTNAEFTRALAKKLRRPAPFPIPAPALRIALGAMADEALLVSTRAIPAKLLAAGFQFRYPRMDEALAAAIARK